MPPVVPLHLFCLFFLSFLFIFSSFLLPPLHVNRLVIYKPWLYIPNTLYPKHPHVGNQSAALIKQSEPFIPTKDCTIPRLTARSHISQAARAVVLSIRPIKTVSASTYPNFPISTSDSRALYFFQKICYVKHSDTTWHSGTCVLCLGHSSCIKEKGNAVSGFNLYRINWINLIWPSQLLPQKAFLQVLWFG